MTTLGPLCPECQEMKDKWLDYRPTFHGYIDYYASLDRRAKIAIENYARQSDDYRNLVRRQIEGIRESCARRHLNVGGSRETATNG